MSLPEPGSVETVRGPVPHIRLGITHAHEHLWCDQRRSRGNARWRPSGQPMVLDEPEVILEELVDVQALGVGTIVETTVAGWGRDAARLQEFSERSGLHIVATSGYYVEACLPADAHKLDVELSPSAWSWKPPPAPTNADPPRNPQVGHQPARDRGVEARCARAVAGAGSPDSRSPPIRPRRRASNPRRDDGAAHLDLFEAEGVQADAVIVGHVDENPDIRHLDALCARGAFVQFDVIGRSTSSSTPPAPGC